MGSKILRSPYPYFGGKSKVSSIIWEKLGNVSNYVEPFAGSLAVLLANPNIPKIETANDINCGITNLWRAISNDPEQVAKYADFPINQSDIHAKHKWVLQQLTEDFRTQINDDYEFYDAKIAGFWIYGMSASIPGNWLNTRGENAIPSLSHAGSGIFGLKHEVLDWFKKLQERTKKVRFCSDDWKKMLTPVITYQNKGLGKKDITGIFLDPPYSLTVRRKGLYSTDQDIFNDVAKWAIDNGDNEKLRIAICGYPSVKFPDNWQEYSWQNNGGLANRAKTESIGKKNKMKEKIWFSPYCLKVNNEKI